MIAPSVTAVLIALAAAQVGVFVRSPLTALAPVHSCHVTVLSVVFPPLVITQVGSVVACVVPPTTATNTRSLPTAGAASCRRSAPAAMVALVAHAVTAV